MSGHSKWHSIRHKKAITDGKRSKLFGQLSNDIAIAARTGTDPAKNPALREAIDRAKKSNLPQANIDRLLNKDMSNLTTVTYEGYGPGGVALLVLTETDNTNRTVAEIRTIFKSSNASLGEQGSVAWKFANAVQATLSSGAISDELELELIEAGADAIEATDDAVTVTAPPSAREQLATTLQKNDVPHTLANTQVAPADQRVELSDEDAGKLAALLNELEEHPDVKSVWTDSAH